VISAFRQTVCAEANATLVNGQKTRGVGRFGIAGHHQGYQWAQRGFLDRKGDKVAEHRPHSKELAGVALYGTQKAGKRRRGTGDLPEGENRGRLLGKNPRGLGGFIKRAKP